MSEADAFVQEVAMEHPITSDDYINYCTFCGRSWAEDNYDEYLKNEALVQKDPDAMFPNRGYVRVRSEHHDSDCIWVKANRIVRNWGELP